MGTNEARESITGLHIYEAHSTKRWHFKRLLFSLATITLSLGLMLGAARLMQIAFHLEREFFLVVAIFTVPLAALNFISYLRILVRQSIPAGIILTTDGAYIMNGKETLWVNWGDCASVEKAPGGIGRRPLIVKMADGTRVHSAITSPRVKDDYVGSWHVDWEGAESLFSPTDVAVAIFNRYGPVGRRER